MDELLPCTSFIGSGCNNDLQTLILGNADDALPLKIVASEHVICFHTYLPKDFR